MSGCRAGGCGQTPAPVASSRSLCYYFRRQLRCTSTNLSSPALQDTFEKTTGFGSFHSRLVSEVQAADNAQVGGGARYRCPCSRAGMAAALLPGEVPWSDN